MCLFFNVLNIFIRFYIGQTKSNWIVYRFCIICKRTFFRISQAIAIKIAKWFVYMCLTTLNVNLMDFYTTTTLKFARLF